MYVSTENAQVRRAVVALVVVDVMDDLIIFQTSSKTGFSDEPVLVHIATADVSLAEVVRAFHHDTMVTTYQSITTTNLPIDPASLLSVKHNSRFIYFFLYSP